jgi:N6-L-threonylcarbamoyladenine synthase/protein kinase Bud32
MCEQRGARFFAPENRFLRDNAGMIAVLGATMYAAGDTLAVEDSGIDSDFRPDEVPVTWREDEPPVGHAADGETVQGAEATVSFEGNSVEKRRQPREYRHPELDQRLREDRTRQEARLLSEARRQGVPTPVLRDVDDAATSLTLQYVGEADLRDSLTAARVETVATHLARLHEAGFVHGDPTTRNVRVGEDRLFVVDFGLGYYTQDPEDHAMDLHVFFQSLDGTEDDAERLTRAAEDAYRAVGDEAVLDCLRDIEGRGRYQ